MAKRIPFGGKQYFDATNKTSYASARMHIYNVGTTTNQTNWSDAGESSANANPLIADSNGIFGPVYIQSSCRVVIKDSDGLTNILDEDNVSVNTGGVPSISYETASTTFTPDANAKSIRFYCIGGGGGGGGGNTSDNWQGGGGGSGGYSATFINSGIASSYTITIGSGGSGAADSSATQATSGGATSVTDDDTSDVICKANGGSGGTSYAAGAGGSISNAIGDLKLGGEPGGAGRGPNADGTNDRGGSGGNGYGKGGAATSVAGQYGGGGAGGGENGAAIYSAGAGGDGIVIIEEYV